MNRWNAIKKIHRYSFGLDELFYRFEEHPTEAKEYDEDDVKGVRFILPLKISMFFPMLNVVAGIGRRCGVELDVMDIRELELEEKGETGKPWVSTYKPVYTVKCTEVIEIESALINLRSSKRELDTYLEEVYGSWSRIKRI